MQTACTIAQELQFSEAKDSAEIPLGPLPTKAPNTGGVG